MNKFLITTDMTADMEAGYFEAKGIERVILPFTVDNVEYDFKNKFLSPKDFYNAIRAGKETATSQVNQYEAEQLFAKHMEQGYDILHLCFSSGQSGSFDNFPPTIKELNKRFPDRKIVVVDTICGSGALGMLHDLACRMQGAGKSMDEIIKWIESNKKNFNHYFIVDDLKQLLRSGRLSKIEMTIGTILGIKPVLALDDLGKIKAVAKIRGKRKAYQALIDFTIKNVDPKKCEYIVLTHGDCIEEVEFIAEQIQAKVDIKVKYAYLNYLVGAHTGPGVVAVFFVGNPR